MDVFHKVLTRIHEITGGRETQEVDFVELLKKEGFSANRDGIKEYLSTEGWITDAAMPGHVHITHWGIAEAKKAIADPTSAEQGIDRHISRLKSATRDFSIVVGEFAANPNAKTLGPTEERLTEIGDLVSKIKKQL